MRVSRLLLALAPLLASAACGGGGDGGPTPPGPAVLTTVTVTPNPASVLVGGMTSLTASARDGSGNAIPAVTTYTFTSSDNEIATVSGAGVVTGVAIGAATITATATHNGVTRRGTSSVSVDLPDGPIAATVAATPANVFAPDVAEIDVGQAVRWNFGTVAHNVIFNPTAGRPTDIPTLASTSAVRTFRTAGQYVYNCTIHAGMTGTVIVQ